MMNDALGSTNNIQESNIQWFQPLFAQTYTEFRRFNPTDRVQAWVVRNGQATKYGEVVTLMNAFRIVTGSAAIMVITLF